MNQKSRFTSIGVVFAALLASACCWLPLLLVAFGVSAIGFSAFFESARPWLLGLTAILLALAIYLKVRPGRMAGECCETDASGNANTNVDHDVQQPSLLRRIPWLLILIAGSSLYLPGYFLAASQESEPELGAQVWLLTLPADAEPSAVQAALESALPDLTLQKQSPEGSNFLLSTSAGAAAETYHLIEQTLAGLVAPGPTPALQELIWQDFSVDGMTCDACTVHVENALDETEDVYGSRVDLAGESASVLVPPTFDNRQAKKAVEDAGYHLQDLSSKG
jgi:copper chaperone CopZ